MSITIDSFLGNFYSKLNGQCNQCKNPLVAYVTWNTKTLKPIKIKCDSKCYTFCKFYKKDIPDREIIVNTAEYNNFRNNFKKKINWHD